MKVQSFLGVGLIAAFALVFGLGGTAIAQTMHAQINSTDPGPPAESNTVEIFVDGDSLRMNTDGRRGSMSMLLVEEQMIMLDATRRMALEIPMAPSPRPDVSVEPSPSEPTASGDPSACRSRRLVRTGNRQTISGFPAELVEARDGSRVCHRYWVSTAAPFGLLEVFAQLGQRIAGSRGMTGPARGIASMHARLRSSGRMPSDPIVRIEDPVNNKVLTLVTADRDPIPAATFTVPAGYSRMAAPFPVR